MTTVHTRLFTVEIPGLFEKVLQFGPLIRAERMDRAPGEESFAELNLYVGPAAGEDLDLGAEAPPRAMVDALWERLLTQERLLGDLPQDAIHSEPSGEAEIRAVLDLEPTAWRPASRQRVWIRPVAGAHEPLFARATLEHDAAFDGVYRKAWESILASLRWEKELFDAGDIEALGEQAWSIFDGMEPDRIARIRGRYAEIVGVRKREPVEVVEPKTVDLTATPDEEITLEFVQEALVVTGQGERSVRLRCSLFDDPIEFTVVEDDGEYEVGPGTVGIWRRLGSLSADDRTRAAQVAWEHCHICFEATDYGAPEGQSNEDYFGIHGPEEAFAELGKGTIYLAERVPSEGHDIFAVDFYPPWEDEHGCSLVMKDGAFAAFASPGDGLRWVAEESDD